MLVRPRYGQNGRVGQNTQPGTSYLHRMTRSGSRSGRGPKLISQIRNFSRISCPLIGPDFDFKDTCCIFSRMDQGIGMPLMNWWLVVVELVGLEVPPVMEQPASRVVVRRRPSPCSCVRLPPVMTEIPLHSFRNTDELLGSLAFSLIRAQRLASGDGHRRWNRLKSPCQSPT